jgi:redox-sensitive bicupin YhaK (pirin superfamily)
MSGLEMILEGTALSFDSSFQVKRFLPHKKKKNVGPFVFWDHFGPTELQKPMIVRSHPHIGLATLTYLFQGSILHRDSLKNEQVIQPKEVNWMVAGKGIAHSERSSSAFLHGIQLWIALPKQFEMTDPGFFHFKEKDLPKIDQNTTLIAGVFDNCKSPVPVFSNLFCLAVQTNLEKKVFKNQTNHEEALYLLNGKIRVENQIIDSQSLVIFKKNRKIEFESLSPSILMIFGGENFKQERHIWWNFVSSNLKTIEDAKEKWKNREFGDVIHEHDWIELPQKQS